MVQVKGCDRWFDLFTFQLRSEKNSENVLNMREKHLYSKTFVCVESDQIELAASLTLFCSAPFWVKAYFHLWASDMNLKSTTLKLSKAFSTKWIIFGFSISFQFLCWTNTQQAAHWRHLQLCPSWGFNPSFHVWRC